MLTVLDKKHIFREIGTHLARLRGLVKKKALGFELEVESNRIERISN